jgi:hypothetical protein
MRVLRDARARPYVLGEHDCFRVACRVVEALTGVDRWPLFAGYATKREALAKIAAFGSTFEHAGDWFFGASSRTLVSHAQRGDIIAMRTRDAQKHLCVCAGRTVYCTLADGMADIPLLAPASAGVEFTAAWKVGHA